jgi:hypothetical protein
VAVLPKIIIGESGNFPELARFWREEVIEKATDMLSGIIAKAIARGEIRDLPVEHIAKLAVAPVLMCLVWHTTFEKTDDRVFNYTNTSPPIATSSSRASPRKDQSHERKTVRTGAALHPGRLRQAA